MKSSKNIRQQYGNSERSKSGKRSDKLSKLDRKSSRGMIYENEELRLRTININAEVERGQTDIKSLRKENEKLRREIWTLRDECDRLNKKVKAKFIEHDQGVYSIRCSGGNGGCSTQCNEGVGGCGCDTVQCKYNSEDSDSCDSCCCHLEDETPCTDDCCNETKKLANISEHEQTSNVVQNDASKVTTTEGPNTGPSILTNFDHLSVVSEETLSNSEVVLAQQSENLLGYTPDISGSQTTLPSLVGPLTPLTPIEMVANELNDLQAVVPPLSYFENIVSQHMNSNYGSTPESSSTTFSGKTIVKHTNGWDYNLESPFAQRRYQANSISPILTKRSPAQTLTTFVPTTTVTPPPADNITSNVKPTLPKKPTDLSITASQYKPIIETVPITTMAPNGCMTTTHATYNVSNDNNDNNDGNTTPKHFFAPIKPKLKLNTVLANQKRLPPPPIPIVAASSSSSSTTSSSSASSSTQSHNNGAVVTQSKCEPPDIYVTNALATPYKPPNKPTTQPPPIPQRITTTATIQAQVSSNSRQHQRIRQQQPQHCRQHYQIHHYQHQQHNNNVVVATNNDVYNNMTAITTTTTAATTTIATTITNTLCTSMSATTNIESFLTTTTTVLTFNTLCNSLNPLLTSLTLDSAAIGVPATNSTLTSLSSSTLTTSEIVTSGPCPVPVPTCFKFINSNINFRKPNDPVYAIAQNVCHNLITAPAVTQPLMSSIVKCCIAKQQQQLQQLITATPSTSSSAAAILQHSNDIVVSIQPSPSAILTSISCNLTINSPFITKPITTATTTPLSLTTATTSTNCIVVDSMCQTDSANLESILNDIEAISEDILAIQLVKNKSREDLYSKPNKSFKVNTNGDMSQNIKNTKPYRSEMNLLLTYDGDNPTIKEAVATKTDNNLESGSNTSTARRTRSLERDHTDSPSPHIPDPMQPFPENRKYIGFDRVNRAAILATAPNVAATATQTSPVSNLPLNQRSQLPVSPLVSNVNNVTSPNGKSLPPTPPQRVYPPSLNIKCAGIARSTSVSSAITATTAVQATTNSPVLSGVPPNKSQLYAALANAAAKRAQFRSQPTHLTKSLDTEALPENINENDGNTDDKEAIENAKRKARRVSIVCADTDSPGTPDKPLPAMRTQSAALTTQPSSSGSCSDLQAILQNPAYRNLKQTSQSTPNSPHSLRKHEGSPLAVPNVPPMIAITPSSTPQHNRNSSHTNGVQQQQSHYHGHSNSYPNVVSPLSQQHPQPRKNSQDTIRASAAEIACAAANAMRSKCSRRHSDGTVSHTNQRISGTSGGTNGTHHHTHHNHHHHQHSSSVVSNTNPHHSHHSRQDSNQETVASYSDRNSNSLASSRESSASFSLRSQRRKLSVSSHTGGKIPWCGCWGNGCL